MTEKSFNIMLDTVLKHTSELASRADNLAKAVYDLIEGGDPEDAVVLLLKYGYVDGDSGEWIYGDDE